MSLEPRLLLSALVAAAVSFAFVPLVRRLALRQGVLIDSPSARSSHGHPKPRGGGLAVLGGIAAGAGVAFEGSVREARFILLGALAFAAVGLWDDLRRLPALPRLLVEVLIAAWVVSEVGPVSRLPLPAPADVGLGPLEFAFSVAWLVSVTNFFNFMDGIDGLAGGEAAVACVGIVAASWSAGATLLAILMLFALLGFLPFNWSPSRIFLGDVGSLPVGFLLAGLPFLAPGQQRARAVLATAIALSLFLLDPVETLVRRWWKGAPIGQSHREHRYQQLLGRGEPHGTVSAALIGAGLLLSLTGAAVYRHPLLGWVGVAVALGAFGLEVFAVRRREASRSSSTGVN